MDNEAAIKKKSPDEIVVALAGNPNVGKSTVFNALTGMKQHTGNWSGKTVANAQGRCSIDGSDFLLVDIPGCYSLSARSAEEESARDFICCGGADAVVVVCAATSLERNIRLVLQIMEAAPNVVMCVNLLDEAARKGIKVDLAHISSVLGIPVVGTSAREGRGLKELMRAVKESVSQKPSERRLSVGYPAYIEAAARLTAAKLTQLPEHLRRYTALRLLDGEKMPHELELSIGNVSERSAQARSLLEGGTASVEKISDDIAAAQGRTAERICRAGVSGAQNGYSGADRRADRILTGRATAVPVMLLLLFTVFWITLEGANYPSELLQGAFLRIEAWLERVLLGAGCPEIIEDMLIHGVFRILGWVVSVMLPPMAIFFPMFTILEDIGFLPRVAFNMDHIFKKSGACGKQSLTMCMGFGCNAAGVTGCRIIDSPRERLIAVLTNSFVPCNGRFPALAAIITAFLTAGLSSGAASAVSAAAMLGVIVLGVAMTLAVSRLLSATLLKGVPSAFTLELPPFRSPQWGQVIVRSLLDRTLFVLGRAAAAAAPAGLLIWVMANVRVSGDTLLLIFSRALDAPGRLMGLDGVILLAFLLGLPANEIVIPIIIMAYTSGGTLTETGNVDALRELFVSNGWTWITGVCMILFLLMHWPCATTCITIYKETRSLRWTAAAVLLPTLCGAAMCILFNFAACLFFK